MLSPGRSIRQCRGPRRESTGRDHDGAITKTRQEDGAVGIENLDRWPSDSAAVGFLSATTSAASVEVLMKVSREWSLGHNLTFTAPLTSV